MTLENIHQRVIETFNTHLMKDATIEALTTGRTRERDDILDVIEANLKAAPKTVQHMIVYGPRGFGKSFLVRMAQIEADKRAREGVPLGFILLPEEHHNIIRSPSGLLDYVAQKLDDQRQSTDHSWSGAMFQWPNPDRLGADWQMAENALDEALDRYFTGRKGLAVVVVENFDILMKTVFKSKQEEQLLRRWMTRPHLRFMILATATGSVDLDYNRPLFQAFRPIRLQPWTPRDCLDYFNRRRAFTGGHPLSLKEEAKARAVSDFIGGTPRLAQLLAEVLDADTGFEKGEPLGVVAVMNHLADRLADYYRNRMNDLSPLARGLVDALIRGGEPCSATELARRVKAGGQNAIGRVMNDLQRADMIRGLPAPDGPEKLFRVVDRVFVHSYRLRQGHSQTIDSPLATILEFLRAFYSPSEHRHQALRFLDAGHPAEAELFARLAQERQPSISYSSYRNYFPYRLSRLLQIAPGAWSGTTREIQRELQYPAHIIEKGNKLPPPSTKLEYAVRSVILAQAFGRMGLRDQAISILETLFYKIQGNAEATIVVASELMTLLEIVDTNNAVHWAKIAGEQISGIVVPYLRINAILCLAWSLIQLGQYKMAISEATEAGNLARKEGEQREFAVAMRYKAYSLDTLKRYDEAIDAATMAVNIAQKLGDKREQAESLEIKAFSLINIAKKIGDEREKAESLGKKVSSHKELERYEEAIDTVSKAVNLAQMAGDKSLQATAMRYKAYSLDALKRNEEAIDAAWKAVSLASEVDDPQEILLARWFLVVSFRAIGRIKEALAQAIAIFEQAQVNKNLFFAANAVLEALKMSIAPPFPEAIVLLDRWREWLLQQHHEGSAEHNEKSLEQNDTKHGHNEELLNYNKEYIDENDENFISKKENIDDNDDISEYNKKIFEIIENSEKYNMNIESSKVLWTPDALIPYYLTAVTRARLWDNLDRYLVQHGDWLTENMGPLFFFRCNFIGQAIARVGQDEGRAEGFDAAQGILTRLAKLVARSPANQIIKADWLTRIISAFAGDCRNPGLLRDVAGLLTEDLHSSGPAQSRLLKDLADYEAAGKNQKGVLARMDPDVALWIRRFRKIPDEPPIQPQKAQKRSRN